MTIINISRGPYELNKEALNDIESRKLTFNVTSRLRYSSESDYVGFQIDLLVMQGKTEVFKSGFLVGLKIDNWANDLQNGFDLNKNREKLQEICKTVWHVATGIIALQSSEEDFNGIVLPTINYSEFSKEVLLIPSASM